MQTHTFTRGRRVSSWKPVQMSTKEGPGWTLSVSCPAGRNLSQCSHKRQLFALFAWNESCFWENRGLSFDVSCLLLAWEWKPKPSRGRERRAENCKPTERDQSPHVVASLRPESLSPFPPQRTLRRPSVACDAYSLHRVNLTPLLYSLSLRECS